MNRTKAEGRNVGGDRNSRTYDETTHTRRRHTMAQHGSLKNLRTSWTADDDRSLAQTVKTVTAQGGSLRDAYTQAARELSRSFEGTRTRARYLRESAQPSKSRPPTWAAVDHGIRLVGTPSDGFTVKTPRAAARKTRAAKVATSPKFLEPLELGNDEDIATLTIEGVRLTGCPSKLYLIAPALCRGIVRDLKTRS